NEKTALDPGQIDVLDAVEAAVGFWKDDKPVRHEFHRLHALEQREWMVRAPAAAEGRGARHVEARPETAKSRVFGQIEEQRDHPVLRVGMWPDLVAGAVAHEQC